MHRPPGFYYIRHLRPLPCSWCHPLPIHSSLFFLCLRHIRSASGQRSSHNDPCPPLHTHGPPGSAYTPKLPTHRANQLLTACDSAVQPADTLLAGPEVTKASCPGKGLAPTREATEHASSGVPSQDPLSLPTTTTIPLALLGQPAQHISI